MAATRSRAAIMAEDTKIANIGLTSPSPETPMADTREAPTTFVGKFMVLKGAVRELWIIFGAKLLAILAYGIMNSTLVLWLSSDLGYSDTRAGFIVTA